MKSIVSECDGFIIDDPYEKIPCSAHINRDGEIIGQTCGEPCRWIMRKRGHGKPPFLSSESIVKEIRVLLLRSSQ